MTLQTALAYQVIYRRAVGDIFAGTHHEIRKGVVRRARALMLHLPSSGNAARDAQRKESLHAIVSGT